MILLNQCKGDQIFECKQLASRLGLSVIKVLEETKSAKKPNKRPIFKQQRTSRIGAMNIELLLPLANSIIEHWEIGSFEQIMLLKNNQQIGYNQAYEY